MVFIAASGLIAIPLVRAPDEQVGEIAKQLIPLLFEATRIASLVANVLLVGTIVAIRKYYKSEIMQLAAEKRLLQERLGVSPPGSEISIGDR